MLEKILKYTVVAGLFAVLLTPLLVADSLFFPFITGKAFFFRIVTEVIFILWLALILLKSNYRPHGSMILFGLILLVLISTLASIFGVNPYRSFWSYYERMDGLLSYFHLLAYFLVLISMLKTERIWQWFLKVSVGVSVLVTLYGLLQLAGVLTVTQGGVRLTATLGNATYLAVYLLVHIFLAVLLLVKRRGTLWPRYLYGGAVVLQLVVLYYTATRGAILGLIGGTLLTLLILAIFQKENSHARKLALLSFVGIIVLLGGFLLFKNTSGVKSSPVLSRFASISLADTTTDSRLTIWRMAIRGFKERPILGWGPENFIVVFNKYYESRLWPQEPWFDRSHNIFLDWLISAGILGLIAYMSLFISVLYYCWQKESNFSLTEKSLFTGLLAAYSFQNLFVFDNLTSYLSLLFILGYVHHRFVTHNMTIITPPFKSGGHRLGRIHYAVLALLLVPLVGAIYFFNLKPLLAAQSLIRGMSQTDLAQKINFFKKSLAYNTFGNNEIGEQVALTASQAMTLEGLPPENKQSIFTLALTELDKQIPTSPNEARTRLFMGHLLFKNANYQQAITQLARAQELSPHKQQIILELARAYYLNGESARAVKLAKISYNLDKSYPEAIPFYINILLETGRYDLLPELWAEQVENNPQQPQNWFSWAAAEFKLGHKDKSIKILRQIIIRFPADKISAEELISQIQSGQNPLAD